VDLAVELCGLRLRNPFVLAAGILCGPLALRWSSPR